MDLTGWISALAVGSAAAGAISDVKTGHIPNWLTLGVLAVAPLAWFGATAASEGPAAGLHALGGSVLAAFLCGLGPAMLFFRGGIGGGDVKLFAALGAVLGLRVGLHAELFSFVFCAAFVPGKLAWQGRLFSVLRRTLSMLANPFLPRARRHPSPPELAMRLRLGPAIFFGTIAALFGGL
jgi:prepilin peptidase CpaA